MTMELKHILVVDDEPEMRETCRKILVRKGYTVSAAGDGQAALEVLRDTSFDLIIVDLRLPDMDGMQLLREVRKMDSQAVTIMITAYGDIDTALQAVQEGAFDYLPKPFSMAQLEVAVERGLGYQKLLAQNRELQRQLRSAMRFGEIIGSSPQLNAVLDLVRKVAPSDANVLLRGETGTGKELIARAIHTASKRSHAPFVPIDCASLPESLLESEMFGHEKGAFTGAIARKRGLLESAGHGTVFLDEIGDLSPDIQARLLRVLQERNFRRVGGTELLEVDIRFVAATNRNLEEMVERKEFRVDLFYRLDVVTIELPPLRDRPGDITLLADYFLSHFCANNDKDLQGISSAALMVLQTYRWPGNVRELKNTIEHAVSLTECNQITPSDLPDHVLEGVRGMAPHPDRPFREAKRQVVRDFERAYLRRLLAETRGNVSEAARRAGMKRTAFHRLLVQHRLQSTQFRK